MRNKSKFLIEQLDKKLTPFYEIRIVIPEYGWINTIRTTLNMTMAQLGAKLNITRQGVKNIELSEAKGTITIKTLKNVASAMGLKLIYVLVPKKGSIDNLISERAEMLAKKIVFRTHQNMRLENQGIANDKLDEIIKELTFELKRELKKSLWD